MKKPKNLVSWLLIFFPILICVLLMLPRLTSAQFGLLDDGNTIKASQSILSGHWNPGWENNRGRFRPTYWLYYALVYWLVGNNPGGFFFTHLLLFTATTAILIYLVWTTSKNPLQAWLSGIVFVLSGPIIEYLSKNTPTGGQVLVDLNANSEYIPEMSFHLDKLYNRPDINLAHSTVEKSAAAQSSLIVSPDVNNQPLLTVRMGFYEEGSKQRNQTLTGNLGQAGLPVHIVERKFKMLNIDLPRLLCPFAKVHRYCSLATSVVDQRELSYRWFVFAYPGG